MQLIIEQNQTVSMAIISGLLHINVETNPPHQKRGPKSLPKVDKKSEEFHQAILTALKDGPLSSVNIRQKIGQDKSETNVVSWALVELQNEDCRRGRNIPKTGPVVKTGNEYTLR